MKRILTAAIGIPLVLVALFAASDRWFLILIVAVIEVAAFELASLAVDRAGSWAPWLLVLLVPPFVVTLVRSASPGADARPALLLVWILVALAGAVVLAARAATEKALAAMGSIAFGVPYLAFPAAALVILRQRDVFLVLLLLALVWAADTAAYYSGRYFGGPKLAPVVSPNKTWAGFLGGLAGALAVALGWGLVRQGGLDLLLCLVAVLTAASAQVGDLVESMLKRGSGVKDSSRILPGHGGVLDRLDSLLFAAPSFLLLLGLFGPARTALIEKSAPFLLSAIPRGVG